MNIPIIRGGHHESPVATRHTTIVTTAVTASCSLTCTLTTRTVDLEALTNLTVVLQNALDNVF